MNTDKNNTQLPQSSVSVSAFLVGKAQTDFWKWYLSKDTLDSHKLTGQHKFSNDNVIKVGFLAESLVCQNAIIIEWFDSVNIYITSKPSEYTTGFITWQYSIRNYQNTPYRFSDRKGAYTEAIIKANEIYNVKFF